MLDLAECVCCCYYKATRALVGEIEADARLLVLKIEGDKINSKCYIECQKENKCWQFVSASEQDNMELCKDNCRPATMYNVNSNVV